MTQKTKTLIFYPDGCVAKRLDNFLYHPISDTLILQGKIWKIYSKYDEFDCENVLLRTIYLTK